MPTHATKRPSTCRTATRASAGRRHLLNSFMYRLRTRPRLSRARRHFRRIPAPLECAGPRALFDRGTIGSKKGVLPVPGPPNGFYFRFPARKNDGPSRTCHGTRPQDGRRYAVPPSPTGQAPKSPAFQARNVRPPPLPVPTPRIFATLCQVSRLGANSF